jgi:deoxyribonuclease-1
LRLRVACRLLCFVVFGGFAALLDYQSERDILSGLMGLLDDKATASELAEPQLPAVADSYAVAKRWLFERVYGDRRETLYCRCPFDRDKRVDHAACGYQVRGNPERAARVEVEHVVPASWIGQGRPCWQQRLCVDGAGRSFKGRKCCARIDPAYRAAYNDLHNLWPSVGEVNEQRRNYGLGLVPGEPRAFGRCDFEVDDRAGVVEPRPEIRGDVARIHLYMEEVHGIRLSDPQRTLLESWHRDDPPDAWERERDRRIERLQGNRNPFVGRDRLAGLN